MSKRTSVLLTTRTYAPEVNAAAFRLTELVSALTRRGGQVTVVTSRPPAGSTVPAPSPAVTISRWPVLRDRGGNVRGYIQYLSYDLPLFLRILFRKFDVVVSEAPPTTGLVAAVVAIVRRHALVYYAADVWTDGVAAVRAPRPVVFAMRQLERFVLRSATRILSVSAEVSERLVAVGADPASIDVVGHGIDTAVFRPDVEPAASGRYFVYTGTMSEVHAPHVLIRAFAPVAEEHPDVTLRFFGQGAYESDLRELAEDLVPGRVQFRSVIPPEEAARWIRGAAAALVTLAPDRGYDYAHPTKAYAAAACGTPVLYAGPDTFGEIIRDNDLGAAVGQVDDAVEAAMKQMLDDATSGRTEMLRGERAQWARDNVSLETVGNRAADVVLNAAHRPCESAPVD